MIEQLEQEGEPGEGPAGAVTERGGAAVRRRGWDKIRGNAALRLLALRRRLLLN